MMADEMDGVCSAHGEMRNAYKILVGKLEGKRRLRIPGYKWKDSIKIDLRKITFAGVGWINMAQDRDRWRDLVNTVINLRVP
jgi:hypothetical protein